MQEANYKNRYYIFATIIVIEILLIAKFRWLALWWSALLSIALSAIAMLLINRHRKKAGLSAKLMSQIMKEAQRSYFVKSKNMNRLETIVGAGCHNVFLIWIAILIGLIIRGIYN